MDFTQARMERLMTLFDSINGEERTYPKPILGFRAWRNDDGRNGTDHLLFPLTCFFSPPWKPGVNISRCHNIAIAASLDRDIPTHDSPAKNCHCGFNAFDHLPAAYAYIQNNHFADNFTYGLIAGAGKIEIHDIGFRSEEAQILALLGNQNAADYYKVPNFESKLDFFRNISNNYLNFLRREQAYIELY